MFDWTFADNKLIAELIFKKNYLLGLDDTENGGVSLDVDDLDAAVASDQTKADWNWTFHPYQVDTFVRHQLHLQKKQFLSETRLELSSIMTLSFISLPNYSPFDTNKSTRDIKNFVTLVMIFGAWRDVAVETLLSWIEWLRLSIISLRSLISALQISKLSSLMIFTIYWAGWG